MVAAASAVLQLSGGYQSPPYQPATKTNPASPPPNPNPATTNAPATTKSNSTSQTIGSLRLYSSSNTAVGGVIARIIWLPIVLLVLLVLATLVLWRRFRTKRPTRKDERC